MQTLARVGLIAATRDSAAALPGLVAATGLVPIDLDGPAPLLDGLVVDIDLSDLNAVAQFRQRTARWQVAHRLFFVSEGRRARADQVQAAALGATGCVLRPVSAARINRALGRAGLRTVRQATPELDESAFQSVQATSAAMSELFERYRGGEGLDVDSAYAAALQALDGLGAVGAGAWLKIVRNHHEGTFQHCLLVAGTAAAYAVRPDWTTKQRLDLIVAALLHDVGKMDVPLAILEKPGKLTPEEFDLIKTHPLRSRDYLVAADHVASPIIDAVLHHHEYLDGSGYPHGLKGADISDMTRALTCCDIFAAMTERRSYKEPTSPRVAMTLLLDLASVGKVDRQHVLHLAAGLGVPAGPPAVAEG